MWQLPLKFLSTERIVLPAVWSVGVSVCWTRSVCSFVVSGNFTSDLTVVDDDVDEEPISKSSGKSTLGIDLDEDDVVVGKPNMSAESFWECTMWMWSVEEYEMLIDIKISYLIGI